MNYRKQHVFLFTLILICIYVGCNDEKASKENKIVLEPVTASAGIEIHIKNLLAQSHLNDGKLSDSIELPFYNVLVHFYDPVNYAPVWSNKEQWNKLADFLFAYLDTASRDGLFKNDYQFKRLDILKKTLSTDSFKMKDRRLWAEADVLYTNAFMHILQDLRQGRLQPDSMALKSDTSKYSSFFTSSLNRLINYQQFSMVIRSVQPKHRAYERLKRGIKKFVDSMDNKAYTYILYPYEKGDKADSVTFVKQLQARLIESGLMEKRSSLLDSSELANVIKRYQAIKKLTADGKISAALIKKLNYTDLEKFKRIAITLDRFKHLPTTMPGRYIWVNLPAFKLEVWDADTVVLESKIICGKSVTPTPIITSAISDLVIYPTWTVPQSIIRKELLPGLKKNTGYLAKKGLNLINSKGEMIDPSTVSWAKYSKGIPYRVQQGSGDGNALGVIKFNFSNPYSVYLHDTNQRYLFKNSSRALSHGCVRVQQWEKLAYYIIRNDSIRVNRPDSIKYSVDSIKMWIINKERHRITVRYQFPLFIRYFGCEAVNGTIKFYDDIYGADKILREKFFSQKKI